MARLKQFFEKFKPTESPESTGREPANACAQSSNTEYQQYCEQLEKTLAALEAQLHTSDDPQEIAFAALKTACDFYQADWAGILEVDMDLGIWTPFWWYNVSPQDRTVTLLNEFESSQFLYRWITAMRQNHVITVTDAETIKDEWPDEYEVYKRLRIQSVIGVPIKPRPVAFLAVRNPKRYLDHSSMLRMLAFVVLSAVNEKKMMDSVKMALSPEAIKYIGSLSKYYFEDVGLRNARLGFRQVEETHLMENIICNELRIRGFHVDIGVVEHFVTGKDGKRSKRQLEVDFVATKGSDKYYIQSAFSMPTSDKVNQEQRSLLSIPDSFRKIIIVGGTRKVRRDENGIITIGLRNFLMDADSLKL